MYRIDRIRTFERILRKRGTVAASIGAMLIFAVGTVDLARSQDRTECGSKQIAIDIGKSVLKVPRQDLMPYGGNDPAQLSRQCDVDRISATYVRLYRNLAVQTSAGPGSGKAEQLALYARVAQSPGTYQSRFVRADWDRVRNAYMIADKERILPVNARLMAIPGTLTAGFEGLPILADCTFSLGQCDVDFRANDVVTVWYRYGIGTDPNRDIVAGYHRIRKYLADLGLDLID